MKITIGIDPGASGGIAWNKDNLIGCIPMPESMPDLIEFFRDLIKGCYECEAYIENVPKYVGNNIPSSTTAVLFRNFGYIEGVIGTLNIRTILVTPQEWQKHFHLGTKKDCASTSEWKNKLKSEAMRRYPAHKITLKTSDAFLILDYAMSKKGQQPVSD